MSTQWHLVGNTQDFPENGGACAQIDGKQIAVFNFTRRGQWYATDNLCPHKQQMALSRGMIGSIDSEECSIPKVACPFHKKNFSLESGECLSGDDYHIQVYPIKVENEQIFVAI